MVNSPASLNEWHPTSSQGWHSQRLSLGIWAGLTPKETSRLVAAKTGTPVKGQPGGTALNKGEEESPWIQLSLKPEPPPRHFSMTPANSFSLPLDNCDLDFHRKGPKSTFQPPSSLKTKQNKKSLSSLQSHLRSFLPALPTKGHSHI